MASDALTLEQLNQFFSLSIDMLCVANLETGHFQRLNPAFEKTLGFTLEELYARPILDFVHPDDVAITADAMQRQSDLAETITQFEHRMLCKDGSYRLLSWKSTPKGTLVYGVARDITDVYEVREREIQSQAFFRAIADNLPNMLFVKDAKDLRFIHFNKAGADLLGITPEGIVGKNDYDLVPKEEAEFFMAKDREVLASGKIVDFDETITSKNGVRFLSTKKVGIKTKNGREYLLGISNDVTDQKFIEHELKAARVAAEQANRAKSEFIANMSHEIRTPLNGVIGITDLLLASELSPEQRKLAQVLQDSGTALLTLIHDVLDFSKIEAGKLSIESLSFDVHQTLESQIGLLLNRAREKKIRVEVIRDMSIPQYLQGDPARIGQIVMNLFGNAVKFTQDGGSIKVKTHLRDLNDDWAVIEYRFEDSGIGITEEEMKKLFSPFTQADGSTARKFGGTGLGLSICKQLAELMNGSVGVTSAPGKGSEFWFTIRVARAQAVPEVSNPWISDSLISSAAGLKQHILVAEDNSVNQLVIKKMLKNFGYTCHLVSNGQEALDAYRSGDFDLILMDCQMPEMDGYEASRLIRQHEKEIGKRVPILAFTANVLKEDRDRCLAVGMDDIICKPVKAQGLSSTIAKWLGRETAQNQTA